MWSWIHGPGRNFLNPLPNKTNYVTMYSKSGKVLDDKKGRDTNQRDTPRDDMDPESIGEDQPDVQKTDGEKESRKPFPLNPQFISQSVLSEELREEIWRRLKVDGKSVRTVSTELFVTMERVAAVFRLKEVEKRWVKEVSPNSLL